MGRKKKGGGGMRGFVRTAKNTQEDTSSSESEDDVAEASGTSLRKTVAVDLENETKAQLRERHQKELKAAKQEATKLGKKKKQEATEWIEGVKERHEEELRRLKARLQSTSEDEGPSQEPSEANLIDGVSSTVGGKKSKAQKRREKEALKLEEREARIREGMEALGATERENEERALKERLSEMGYEIFDIRPDGHCLYGSIADQLSFCGGQPTLRTEDLRKITAKELRSNIDAFLPFFVAEGDSNEDAFLEHCDKIEQTAEWGGQMEVEALSKALKKKVVIYSVGLGETTVGERFEGDPLRICFMQHAFQLGAHYNSVRQKQLEE